MQISSIKYFKLKLKFKNNKAIIRTGSLTHIVNSLLLEPLKQRLIDVTSFMA